MIGGETAEMPGMYPEANTTWPVLPSVWLKRNALLTAAAFRPETLFWAWLPTAHTPTATLWYAKSIERDNPDLDAEFDNGKTLREAIIAPTRLYVKPILAALEKFTIKGMAHITGGGITENVPRILPENTVAQIDAKAWELPKLFQWLQKAGNVETQEMYRTFNCGIGMVVIIAKEDADAVQAFLSEQGETVYRLGVVRERNGDEHQTQVA